jgi:hypothetical protein
VEMTAENFQRDRLVFARLSLGFEKQKVFLGRCKFCQKELTISKIKLMIEIICM